MGYTTAQLEELFAAEHEAADNLPADSGTAEEREISTFAGFASGGEDTAEFDGVAPRELDGVRFSDLP